jgi:Tol biopolymer transport system component
MNVIRIVLLYLLNAFCLLLCFSGCATNDKSSFKEQYFGQEHPGLTPEIFARNIITGNYTLHGFPTFSPDGKEIYWPIIPPKIMYVKYENKSWTSSLEATFSENNIQAPCFSLDGNRIYYQVTRNGGYGSLDIWYVERVDTGWSNPQNIGLPINSSKLESQPSLTNDGTIYFAGELEGVMFNRGIYKSRYVNGRYIKPELLPESINTQYLDYTPFISSDESFLLYSSTRPSEDENNIRIYMSFHNQDGSWTDPINLNKVMDFDQPSRFPSITPDGKFIIFQSGDKYYWVSSKIIDKCK